MDVGGRQNGGGRMASVDIVLLGCKKERSRVFGSEIDAAKPKKIKTKDSTYQQKNIFVTTTTWFPFMNKPRCTTLLIRF